MAKEKKPKPEKAKTAKKSKTIVCPFCEMEVPKKAKICPRCGKPLPKKKKGPMVVLLPILLILVLALVSVVVFAFPVGLPIELPFGLPIKLGPKLSDTTLGAAMELTEKQEKAVMEVLGSCGFGEIVSVEELPSAGKNQAYAVIDEALDRYTEGEDAVVKVNEENKEVVSVSFRSSDLYADGAVVSQLSEHYLNAEDRDALMVEALDAVKSRLDLPETAVFPSRSNWNYTEDGDRVIVSATVTAKKNSGVTADIPFEVIFEGKEVTAVSLGDSE